MSCYTKHVTQYNVLTNTVMCRGCYLKTPNKGGVSWELARQVFRARYPGDCVDRVVCMSKRVMVVGDTLIGHELPEK